MKSIGFLIFVILIVACDDKKIASKGRVTTVALTSSTSLPSDYTGKWIVKSGDMIVSQCDYVAGKKHGEETLYYYFPTDRNTVMSVIQYADGVKNGICKRYELTTEVLISRSIYRDGAIWSGAALFQGREIDPEVVIVKDLAYWVKVYEAGNFIRDELSSMYFHREGIKGE